MLKNIVIVAIHACIILINYATIIHRVFLIIYLDKVIAIFSHSQRFPLGVCLNGLICWWKNSGPNYQVFLGQVHFDRPITVTRVMVTWQVWRIVITHRRIT